MLARQAIDPEKIARHESEAMLFRGLDSCSHCMQKDICREWLENAESRASYIRFCPNSETTEALRVDDSQALQVLHELTSEAEARLKELGD